MKLTSIRKCEKNKMGKLKYPHAHDLSNLHSTGMYKLCTDFRYAGCDNVLVLTTVIVCKIYSSSQLCVKDRAYVMDLLDSVFGIKCQHSDIVKLYRLGRWSEDESTIRPLLVGFSHILPKTTVMNNLRQLKQADQRFKTVSISNDLTPKQREEIKKLVADAKRDHAANSSEDEGNFRFLVVGQGQRKRVIKVRKQN